MGKFSLFVLVLLYSSALVILELGIYPCEALQILQLFLFCVQEDFLLQKLSHLADSVFKGANIMDFNSFLCR